MVAWPSLTRVLSLLREIPDRLLDGWQQHNPCGRKYQTHDAMIANKIASFMAIGQ